MSLKSFFAALWANLKKLFTNLPEELQAAVHIGVTVTQNIKTFVDSPAADVLTALIPGELDNRIKAALRVSLPAILTELKLADSCGSVTDPGEITACAIKLLQSLKPDTQSAFLHSLSILIAQVAADGKLTWSDGATVLEWYYQHEYKAS